jgi:hypothetical protein
MPLSQRNGERADHAAIISGMPASPLKPAIAKSPSIERRWAWMIAVAGLLAASGLGDTMATHGVRPNQVYAATFFVGLAAGALWQRLHPVDVVDRFFGLALLGSVLMIVVAVPGVSGSFAVGNSFAPFGVLIGVVLAEGFSRPRRGR